MISLFPDLTNLKSSLDLKYKIQILKKVFFIFNLTYLRFSLEYSFIHDQVGQNG